MDRISMLSMSELLTIQKMFEKPKVFFYGIEEIEIRSNGEWADPTLIYKNKKISHFHMEGSLYSDFIEENGKDGDYEAFSNYVKDNKCHVLEIADYLYDNDIN